MNEKVFKFQRKKSDKKLDVLLASGGLISDEIVINMVKSRLERDDVKKGFLLDGFPRTVNQAQSFDEMLRAENKMITAVFYVEISPEESVRRISGRRICSSCGANYDLLTHLPKVENVCDVCKSEIIQRSDDKEDVVRNRLEVYERQTKPLTDYYRQEGLLVNIDGQKDEKEVFAQITNFIESRKK